MATEHETNWLTTDEQKVWRSWLDAVARVDQFLDADLRRSGLDLGEYEILVRLSEAPNRQLRMSELADAVRQSRSRLTHAVGRLEKRNLVERTSAPDDRRGVIAVLTDTGFSLLEQAAPSHVTAVRRILVDAMTPAQYAELGRAMQAVLAVED